MSLSLLTGLGQMGVGGGKGGGRVGLRVLTLSLPDCSMEFCKVTLTLSLEPNPMYDVTIQMKALCLYLLMVKCTK